MIYALDFDGVLDNPLIQRLVLKLKRERNEIWVVTMRRDDAYNNDIIQIVLDKMYITKINVVYSNGKSKCQLLKAINADIYIDNVSTEFNQIKETTKIIPLLFN